jgi:hypothetical protein
LIEEKTFQTAKEDYVQTVMEMTRNMSNVLYVGAMIAVVVGVDLLFFKNRFWERLMANIGIVLVFAAFYLRFLKNP